MHELLGWEGKDFALLFHAHITLKQKENRNAASILNPLKGNEAGNISVGFHFRSITKRTAVGL